MKTHKDLQAWRSAVDLAKEVYEVTSQYPKEELYGLCSQMRRSAVSIASNIVEGASRSGKREFAQFLRVALGSASELDTQVEISKAAGLHENAGLERLQERVIHVKKLVYGLIRSLRS